MGVCPCVGAWVCDVAFNCRGQEGPQCERLYLSRGLKEEGEWDRDQHVQRPCGEVRPLLLGSSREAARGLLGVRGEAGEVLEGGAWMQSWRGGRGDMIRFLPPGLQVVAAWERRDWNERTVESAESRAWYTQ